jgi:hypothetical protein
VELSLVYVFVLFLLCVLWVVFVSVVLGFLLCNVFMCASYSLVGSLGPSGFEIVQV